MLCVSIAAGVSDIGSSSAPETRAASTARAGGTTPHDTHDTMAAAFGTPTPVSSVLLPPYPVAIEFNVETKTMQFTVGDNTETVELKIHNMDGLQQIHPHGDMYFGTIHVGDSKYVVHFEYLFTKRDRPGNERTIEVSSYVPPGIDAREMLRRKVMPWTKLMEVTVDTEGNVKRWSHYPPCPAITAKVVEAPLGGFSVSTPCETPRTRMAHSQ
jgi:hypothetical protein